MSRDIGTSRRRSRVGDVEGPLGDHRCRCRGAHARRCRRPVRPFEVMGHPFGRPVPRRGARRVRGPVPAPQHHTDSGREVVSWSCAQGLICWTSPSATRSHECRRPRSAAASSSSASSRPTPKSGPDRPTHASKPICPTSAGSPTSATGRSPTARLSRSSPGSTTAPATPCRSPPTGASPAPSRRPHSTTRALTTAFPPPRSPTTPSALSGLSYRGGLARLDQLRRIHPHLQPPPPPRSTPAAACRVYCAPRSGPRWVWSGKQ